MIKASGTFKTLGWRFVLLLPLLSLYVTAFWGSFGPAWPAPVRRYTGFVLRSCWQYYHSHVTNNDQAFLHYPLIWMAVSILFGGLLPLLVMALFKRWPTDVGLGLPNRWGWRVILICMLVVLPLSFVFAHEQLSGQSITQAHALLPLIKVLIMIGVSVPEHILLTGICVALFLPGFRLPAPSVLAPLEGSSTRCVLRWLGLAQPGAPGMGRLQSMLAWWGLDVPGFWAIIGGGLLFGIVHVGAQPIELTTSFPGGIAVCYLTYRSRSIWPGWLVHMAQMILVTLALQLIRPN